MNKIIVASANPVKINSSKIAFEQVFQGEQFEVEGIETPSGVAHQPISEEETLRGALNRLEFIQQYKPKAQYWVSIEGGIKKSDNRYEAFAWVIVKDKKLMGKAMTASFELPEVINALIDQGLELGHADDKIFNRKNSKMSNY